MGTWLSRRISLQTSNPSSARKHHVEHDELERRLAKLDERLAPVTARSHPETGLLEAERRDLPDGGVVLDEKQMLVHGEKPTVPP